MAIAIDIEKTINNIEDIRKIFEHYINEKVEDAKTCFYLPAEDIKAKEPVVILAKKSLSEQNGFFSLFFYLTLKRYNQIFLSSRILGIEGEERQKEIANKYCPYILIENPNSWCRFNIGFLDPMLERINKTSMILHLINEFEIILEREPQLSVDSMKKVSFTDWGKYNCISIDGKKCINLKNTIILFFEKISKVHAGLVYEQTGNLKTNINFNSVLNVLEEALLDCYNDAKREIDKGEGLIRITNSLNRQNQGQNQTNSFIPQPKPKKGNSKNGKRRK